ncbi:hypothetical protein ONS96_000384 [Cadophora gregata f. sp. sojae]|nr:hypothetical protein ONS96_000384 [Cadophora gregata f. sp. sojae]
MYPSTQYPAPRHTRRHARNQRLRSHHPSAPLSTSTNFLNDPVIHSVAANIPLPIPTKIHASRTAPAVRTPRPCPNLHLHTMRAQTHECCYSALAHELKIMIVEEIVRVFTSQHRFIQLRFRTLTAHLEKKSKVEARDPGEYHSTEDPKADRYYLIANTPNPLPLSICRLSREEAMKYYKRLDEPGCYKGRSRNEYMAPIYIYPDHDTIVFCPVKYFGEWRCGNWGVFPCPNYGTSTGFKQLLGSGCYELQFFLFKAMLFNLMRDNLIKTLAIRPGEGPYCINGVHCCTRSRFFHKNWTRWSFQLRDFLGLEKLIIFHEYHSPFRASSGHRVPHWESISRFEEGLRARARHDVGLHDNRISKILVADSRCMPAPGEYFEMTEENLAAKKLRSLGNEWKVRVPRISENVYGLL